MLAVVPLVIKSLGAPLGEPFADDFDYLYRALLDRSGGFFDGYGSGLYWRPVGRQLYFGLFSPLILERPVVVPVLHAVLLAAAGLLIYRALRQRWPAPWAACAGGFVALSESSRMLLAWPSHFMDLGAILFAAIALHEASRTRLWTALIALVISLLSKEVGLLAGLLLPWMPAATMPPATRVRWTLATAAVIAAWGMVYTWACVRHGLEVPHPADARAAAALALVTRAGWAVSYSLRAAFSLPAAPGPIDMPVACALGGIALVVIGRAWVDVATRRRLRDAVPWITFGLAWFALATAPLVQVYPAWAPYRSAFGVLGLGIALTAVLGAVHRLLVVSLVVVRLAGLGFAPGAQRGVTIDPSESGAAFDFPRLVRLERTTFEMRQLLRSHYPRLPAHSVIALENLPRLTDYAFSGDKALRTWYRDTTLRMVRMQHMEPGELDSAVTIVEYVAENPRPFSFVRPPAMQSLLRAIQALQRADWEMARSELDQAQSLQLGERAPGFEATVVAMRSTALMGQARPDSAEAMARQALALSPRTFQARWVLVRLCLEQGRRFEAEAQLDTLVALNPADPTALALRNRLRGALDSGSRRPGAPAAR